MKELVGKLTALDAEASQTLAVISYFDTLMDARVSVETLLRGAATLSGVAAAYRRGSMCVRVLSDGRRGEAREPGDHESHAVGPDAVVWLERDGPAHANDAMIRERLAIAVAISAAARTDELSLRRPVEVLLSESAGEREQLAAMARLQLDPGALVRAVARPSGAGPRGDRPAAILATPWGIARGEIIPASDVMPEAEFNGRAGVGVAGTVAALPESWRTAVIALLLADDAHPLSHADDLGVLLPLTDRVGRGELPPDVATLDRILTTSWSLAALQALADGLSIRAVAQVAGLHHSTVHARLPELARLLGYEPLTPLGRTRLFTGLLLRRVTHTRLS